MNQNSVSVKVNAILDQCSEETVELLSRDVGCILHNKSWNHLVSLCRLKGIWTNDL